MRRAAQISLQHRRLPKLGPKVSTLPAARGPTLPTLPTVLTARPTAPTAPTALAALAVRRTAGGAGRAGGSREQW